MRTTVTLEDDVATEIAKLQEARGEPFKQTLNTVLRAGLATLLRNRPGKTARYRTVPVSLGKPRLSNVDDISEVLAFAEGEEHP
jgi:hypothetical protein